MANLMGQPDWIRGNAINIAHPDFRDELVKAAAQQGIWKRSNKSAKDKMFFNPGY